MAWVYQHKVSARLLVAQVWRSSPNISTAAPRADHLQTCKEIGDRDLLTTLPRPGAGAPHGYIFHSICGAEVHDP